MNEHASAAVRALARQADVEPEFVERVLAAGAIPAADEFGPREARRVRLLRAWEGAGLSVELVMRLVGDGTLSLAFLDTPVIAGPEPLDATYQELAIEEGVSLTFIQRVHEAIGFEPPRPDDHPRANEPIMVGLARWLMSIGASESAVLRLFRVYADGLRKLAQAEAELFETEVETKLRTAGMNERQILDFGSDIGDKIISLLEGSIISIYRRHREHVWIEHSTNHAEVALDQAGLHPRVPRVDTICFVDLTGYTRLTEQRGDELAARFAAELAALVENVSVRRKGRPIRWLGDGGMFHFRDPASAALAGLDMVDGALGSGLPPTHIGIHTGPVIFQDGDVYGRTVNLAARISAQAQGGEVLMSQETAVLIDDPALSVEPARTVALKGIEGDVTLYRATRAP
jgi:class 3 adenylate cyclase